MSLNILKENDSELLNCSFISSLISECKYYDTIQFDDLNKGKRNNKLAILHFNTRSLPKNVTKIESFLIKLSFLPEIIAITETKLNSSNCHLVDIDNYQFVHYDSALNSGGVGLYIRSDLQYLIKTNLRLIAMIVKAYLLKFWVELMQNLKS